MSPETGTQVQNPLAEGLSEYRSADPALMVLFGATGDLSQRKLLPSLFNLARNRLLPMGFMLVGAAMDDLTEEQFRDRAADSIRRHSRTQPVDEDTLDAFLKDLTFVRVDFSRAEDFQRLRARLAA